MSDEREARLTVPRCDTACKRAGETARASSTAAVGRATLMIGLDWFARLTSVGHAAVYFAALSSFLANSAAVSEGFTLPSNKMSLIE